MSHSKNSNFLPETGSKAERDSNWLRLKASELKTGHCIKTYHDKIAEAIELTYKGSEEDRENAKKTARKGTYCIIMNKDISTSDGQYVFTLLHVTKALGTRFARQIYMPLPHSSKTYAEFCDEKPLEVVDGSPEFTAQSYVIPYEKFKVAFDSTETIQVSNWSQTTKRPSLTYSI